MKRYKDLYAKIYDFENLYEAYLEARKNKRYKEDVLQFSAHLEENLIILQNELIYKTYRVGHYHQFMVSEPKKRLIMALPFRDRVVQWAIYRQLNPLLDRQFIEDSYACRIGKGTHNAVDRLQYWLRKIDRTGKQWYCLKMDVAKYFYRVDHEILMRILERKIKDKELLWLLSAIINSEDTAFGLPLDADIADNNSAVRLFDCGMPIGNLTSQMFANLYLNELDQFVKQELREHYYIRYMDDMLILTDSKAKAHALKAEIERFLDEQLHLNLNNKTGIRPVYLGVEFLGFRVWATHRKLRKSSAKKLRRGLRNLRVLYSKGRKTLSETVASAKSYFSIFRHFDGYNLRRKLCKTFVLRRNNNKTH
jgi:retron-type reverse transcriptase